MIYQQHIIMSFNFRNIKKAPLHATPFLFLLLLQIISVLAGLPTDTQTAMRLARYARRVLVHTD